MDEDEEIPIGWEDVRLAEDEQTEDYFRENDAICVLVDVDGNGNAGFNYKDGFYECADLTGKFEMAK